MPVHRPAELRVKPGRDRLGGGWEGLPDSECANAGHDFGELADQRHGYGDEWAVSGADCAG